MQSLQTIYTDSDVVWFWFGQDLLTVYSRFGTGRALGAGLGISARQELLGVVGGPAHDPRVDVVPLAACLLPNGKPQIRLMGTMSMTGCGSG